jgi:hypothetical protein
MKDDRKRWLDHPRHVSGIVYTLAALCLLLVLADLFYEKHTHFAWEGWFGFFGFFGFIAFFLIVLSGRPLRRLLMREEDYYDR